MIKLAPSILSADFGRLSEQLNEVERAGAHLIHVDVMDGHFVPNITIGPMVVKAVKKYTGLPLDVHLMITNPADHIDVFLESGADLLSFHLEASAHTHGLIQKIKRGGARAGVAINPATSLKMLESVIADVDLITLMSVNPGFGGQTFIESSLEKLKQLRAMILTAGADAEIEIDGGITSQNAGAVVEGGADILVAGAAVFAGRGIDVEVKQLLSVAQSAARNV